MSTPKFSASVASLRDAIQNASGATPANPSMVAYSGVQLIADERGLTIIGSDGETTITASTHATIERTGSVLLPPKPISTLLARLAPSLTATVSLGSDGELVLEAGSRAPYRFRPLSATFPQPAQPAGGYREIDLGRLSMAIAAVRHATSRDLPAIQLVSDDQRLLLNATDSYRLAQAVLPEGSFGPFTGLVPLSVLERVARAGADAVATDPRSRLVSFRTPGATITTRLLATAFPAVDGVLASIPTSAVRFETQPILDGLGRLAAVAADSPVRVSIEANTISLEVSNVDLGSGTEEAPLAAPCAQPIEFHVKLQYLIDALSRFDAVALHYSSPTQPLFVRSTSPVESTQVVMPIRL